MVKAVSDVWQLFRLHAAGTYAVVVAAALLFGNLPPAIALERTGILFVPFVVLLYGGIYTINGIADRRDDALHSIKRHRPVASGRVSPSHAWVLAVLCIALAVACAWSMDGLLLVSIFCLFLGLNAVYTFAAKRVPYVELLFNGSTYLLRAVMGAAIAGGQLPAAVGWSVFWSIVGVSAARRMGELCDGHTVSRPTLRWYTQRDLLQIYHACTIAIAMGIAASRDNASLLACLIVLAVHATIAYGAEASPKLRKAAQW